MKAATASIGDRTSNIRITPIRFAVNTSWGLLYSTHNKEQLSAIVERRIVREFPMSTIFKRPSSPTDATSLPHTEIAVHGVELPLTLCNNPL
ncbi:hypothetical protein GQX74_014585 [Glossina fuscipes]|uniref:Uncharacterized protein n=1 Tax=Glossina palpalis gambiensis TaxID=67801 RepID=A0A1B0AVF8_9MUSC|nr:hypothetical protein GQX74_014585 [Glossina fuscipes]